jgi:thiamine pyrophosphate-dependent acetolactate synthase large subunit-like protein
LPVLFPIVAQRAMRGAELLAKAIKRQDVGTVFGLPGHLEIFFDTLLDHDIRLIHMRHEAAPATPTHRRAHG